MEDPEQKRGSSGYSQYGKAIRSAGPLFGAGIQLAASVVLMFFVGRWLDGLAGSAPWLMIAGIAIGFGAGLYSFIKLVSSVEKNKSGDRP